MLRLVALGLPLAVVACTASKSPVGRPSKMEEGCAEPAKGPLVTQQIRVVDRMSTAYEASGLTLKLDGRPLFSKADERSIVAAMRESKTPTFTTTLPAGCHVLRIAIAWRGTVDPIKGYAFEVFSTRVFDTAEGELLETVLYEANSGPYEERPALRYRHVGPRVHP